MWEALRNLHELCGHNTTVQNLQIIFKTYIAKDADIPHHLKNIKSIWENISELSGNHYNFSNKFFKLIITCILPCSWYMFAEPYLGAENDTYCNDPKCTVSLQEFLGILVAEYKCQNSTTADYQPDLAETSNIGTGCNWQNQQKGKGSLITQITPSNTFPQKSICRLCRTTDH
jgi:hypothetical protein